MILITREKDRTVAQLLSTKDNGILSALQNLKHRGKPRHTYIYCRSTAIAKRFLKDAENEGFLFSDGMVPTEKETSNLYALHEDFTICYTGLAAHMMFGRNDVGNVVWIDYGKYVSGNKHWQINRPERPGPPGPGRV